MGPHSSPPRSSSFFIEEGEKGEGTKEGERGRRRREGRGGGRGDWNMEEASQAMTFPQEQGQR